MSHIQNDPEFEGSHIVATGSKAEGFEATSPKAACFTVRCFGEATCFAKVAGFGEVTCFGDLPCFDEPLMISGSLRASLTSIDRSTNAAIAAMMAGRRGQTAKPDGANFFSDDSNPCFPTRVISVRASRRNKSTLTGIRNHELLEIYLRV
jgi:hypothetical protein